jgi:molybdopterin synthase sulfur carrier subunit
MATTTVRVPGSLRAIVGGQSRVTVEGATVGDALAHLEQTYPALQGRLRDDNGAVTRFINLFVGGEDVRLLEGLKTPLDGAELSIVPAVAGG